MIKKIILICFLVLLLAAIGFGIFLSHFNADQVKGFLIKKMEETTGAEVSLEKLSLTWHHGLSLELQGVSLTPRQTGEPHEPVLSARTAMADLDLFALLRQNLRLGAITFIDPKIRLVRTPEGDFTMPGIYPAPKKKSEVNSSLLSTPVSFLIESLTIQNAAIEWTDNTLQPSARFVLDQMDLKIKNISLTTPIRIQTSGRLLSSTQNISVQGQLLLPLPGRSGEIRNLQASIDLTQTDTARLLQLFSKKVQAVLHPELRGQLKAEARKIILSNTGLGNLEASIHLTNGHLGFRNLRSAFDELTLNAEIQKGELHVEIPTCHFAGGEFSFTGTATGIGNSPQTKAALQWNQIRLEDLQTAKDRSEPSFEGISSGTLQAVFNGATLDEIQNTMNGSGEIKISGPKLRNINLLGEVFGKLSMIPGLSEKLQTRLPPSYAEKFRAEDTLFQDIQQPFTLRQGTFLFEKLTIVTETMALLGNATLNLRGLLSAATTLVIDPHLSNALIKSVNELSLIADSKGQLQIPVRIEGPLSHLSFLPDLQYLATRLATAKLTSTLENVLIGSKKTSSQTSTDPKAALLNSLIGSFLDQASSKK